jgi:hypothetical protein
MDVLVVVFTLLFVGVVGWSVVAALKLWKGTSEAQYLVFALMSLAILLVTIASVYLFD